MTVARVDKLTPAQEAAMAPWAQEWITRGLCTDPADRDGFERAAEECYRHAGLAWHGNVVWAPNPLVVAFAGPIAIHVLRRGGAVGGAVRGAVDGAVGGAVDGAVGGAVGGAVRGAVGGAVHRAVGDVVHGAVGGAVGDAVDGAVDGAVGGAVDGAVDGAVGGAVDGAVRGAVHGAVDGAVRGAVGDAVHGAVRGAVRGAVGGAVHGAVRGAVHRAVGDNWWRYLGGQWWLSWHAYTSFFRDVCGLKLPGDLWDRDRAYAEAQAAAGWWWPHERFIIVADRPERVTRERVGPNGWGSHQLHNPAGPAIRYRDGWGLHFWHGVHVPAWVIEGPTVELIQAEENTEVRRCAIEAFGWPRYLRDIGATPVDTAADPGNPGRVLRLYDLPDQAQVYGEPVRLLVMENASLDRDGTRRVFAETVPAGIQSATAAAAWQFNTSPETYVALQRAT